MDNYIPKAKTTIIKFNSRASIKIKESFYTFEYGEERQIDNTMDKEKEIQALTNDCNVVVDGQLKEIVNMVFKK